MASPDSGLGHIGKDLVTQMEKHLEGEYVPFYFHDLRTNEIITFHAFITALTETFSPNWSSQSAYGRIDDVQIYKNTTRNISLSFVIASTAPADHTAMWYKINRLVAMVYPQWSPGKMVQAPQSGQRFRMPFSQIPTASPVIRMRIGDLISSNYSKFGLERLFGLGEPGFLTSFAAAAARQRRQRPP